MADPNWLYSSVVQSSAAIVAVVGAFVTGTVINLSTKRSSVTDLINESQQNLEVLSRQRDEESLKGEIHRINYWLEKDFDDIFRLPRPLPDASEVRQRLRYGAFSAKAFAVAWKQYSSEFMNEESWLKDELSRNPFDEGGFEHWTEQALVDPTGRNEYLLSRLYDKHYAEWRRSQPKQRPISYEEKIPEFMIPPVPESIRAMQENQRRDEDQRNLQEMSAFLDRAKQIELEMERVAARLERLRNEARLLEAPPRHLIFGFSTLAFLALGGIVVPLLLMPQSDDTFHAWHKWLVISLFILGLAGLFLYMAILLFPSLEVRWSRRISNILGQAGEQLP